MTGGTIDSHWVGKQDTVITNSASVLPEYFSNLIVYADVEFTEVCMKDSRELTQDDMQVLCSSIEKSANTKILITHGTYTMPDTARYLSANLKRNDQTIMLTGSMVPLDGFHALSSDAGFNLGYAFARVQDYDPGIYLVMNGRVFLPDEVAKNIKEGKFYSVFDRQ